MATGLAMKSGFSGKRFHQKSVVRIQDSGCRIVFPREYSLLRETRNPKHETLHMGNHIVGPVATRLACLHLQMLADSIPAINQNGPSWETFFILGVV